jgi:hypothetical protein
MPISTKAAKSKGRALQKWLAAFLIDAASEAGHALTDRDVRSTSMGVGGPDLQLSERAARLFGVEFECKNETNPTSLARRYWTFVEKNKLPTIAVFKRTSRSVSSIPIFVVSVDLAHALGLDEWCELDPPLKNPYTGFIEYLLDEEPHTALFHASIVGRQYPTIVLLQPDHFKRLIIRHLQNRPIDESPM